MSEQPLLSICIPTYNRADYLTGLLENITDDPAFNDAIEVIINDNASTDNTEKIGSEFAQKHTNIKYFRNQENVRDRNFKICLGHASGRYLKLINDTVRFKPGALSFFLEVIKQNKDNLPILFSRGGEWSLTHTITVRNVNELALTQYEQLGWLGQFGLNRTDDDCLNINKKYYDLQFPQIAWLLEIIKKNGQLKLFPGDFYEIHDDPKKGGYNLFKVQSFQFFTILRDYGLKGKAYEKVKYQIFRKFFLPMYRSFIYEKKETNFITNNSFFYLLKNYWYNPYFYAGLLKNKLRVLLRGKN